MRILIVGGTSFVGRGIAFAALNAGHDVTVINRGQTPSDLPESVTRLIGDRHGDLSALEGLTFDVTIDAIAYRPIDVDALATALEHRGGHHIQISSVSAYEDPPSEGATEETVTLWNDTSLARDAEVTAESYGPLKAACERAAEEQFGDQLTIVRPTFVIGSHDATLRFPYWVQRLRIGGNVAVPGPRDNALQYIDARDLGEFVATLATNGTLGAFHAAGPYPPGRFVEVIESIKEQISPSGTHLIEISPRHIKSHHLDTRFPLWSGSTSETALAVDPAKAVAAGLKFRDLSESVEDVAVWWDDREPPSWWLTREQEAMLVRTNV
ncbi:MAG TPA: NAD-dependent epimerase/dehydratase family protein [Acidimicrobiales bacterium]|nr:NAD-dependent epimerase/dehydratase family protein [Acidimicrobiales bacterium]